MPKARNRGVLLKLTEEQFRLAKRRMALDDLTWQNVGQAAINAYILGHLRVNARGEGKWDPDGDAATFSEDPAEAVRQVKAAVKGTRPKPKPVREWWDVPELAEHLEERTGRRVGVSILRMYLKRHWSHTKEHDRARWKFYPDSAVGRGIIDQIAEEVGKGALAEMRAERFAIFGKDDPLKGA